MKKGLLTLAVCTLVLTVNGQWDWGSGSSGSGSGSGSGTSGSTGSGSGTSGGSSTGGSASGGAAAGGGAAAAAPTLAVPTIGTHYDDPPASHKELPQTVNDGRPGIDDAVPVPYPYLREADVKFKRRVWRRIDTRQKMNKSFTWPKNPVTQIIYEAGVKGLIQAYWTDSLEGGRRMTPEDAYKQGSVLQTPQIQNWRNPADPTDLVDTAYYDIFKWEKIIRFEVMEDWIFDYKYSELRPRIIAIAPLYQEKINGVTYEMPLFWLKMDDLRPTLAKSEVYNRYNDVMRISWDDLFNNYRLFDSYIVKQTDGDDKYIAQKSEYQQDGLGALIEGENIKNDLFIFEHDLWEF